MKSSVKKILALFLFSVFAFPFIQKELHSFEHRNEVTCNSKTEKHFHEQEHNCSVCDFTLPSTVAAKESLPPVKADSSSFKYTGLTQQIIYFFVEQFFLQRAPPEASH